VSYILSGNSSLEVEEKGLRKQQRHPFTTPGRRAISTPSLLNVFCLSVMFSESLSL
jgi:hypothetical protein